MKNLLILFSFLLLTNVTYAAFPVLETSHSTLLIEEESTPSNPRTSNTAGWGIASLILGVLGLAFPPLGVLALIFGAIGLKKRSKGLAITGLILGIIETIATIALVIAIIFASGISYY